MSLHLLPAEIIVKIFKYCIEESWLECNIYRNLYYTCPRFSYILVDYFPSYHYFSVTSHCQGPEEITYGVYSEDIFQMDSGYSINEGMGYFYFYYNIASL
jgi:hypothetical protein